MVASRWRALRPPATDIAIAAGFVVLGQFVTWGRFENPLGFTGPRLTNAILNLLLMSALAWRRRAPLAAVCWAVAVYFLPHALAPHDMTFLGGAVPLIVLTASAGYHCPRRRALLAAAVAMIALVTVTLTTDELGSTLDFTVNTLFLLVPWLGARSLRAREHRAARLATALAMERVTKSAALADASAAERTRIARELHDIVAHSVSMMVIQIGAARMQLQAGAQLAEESLLAAESVGRQALGDLRRLLSVLRADEAPDEGPAKGPQPGLSQLDEMVGQIRAAGLDVEVEVSGGPVQLSPALELASYRIVQEALTNTLKHSSATHTRIRLAYAPSKITIDVLDNGTATSARDSVGHGLVGIKERASFFGGTVSAGPTQAGGWCVHAELPLPIPSVGHEHPAGSRAS